MDKNERRRVWKMMAASLALAVVAAAGAVWLLRQEEPARQDPATELTQAQVQDAQGASEAFVKGAGTFGVRQQAAQDARGLRTVLSLVATNPQAAPDLFLPRSAAYLGVRELVLEGSPAWYDTSKTSAWGNTLEVMYLMSVTADSVTSTVHGVSPVSVGGTPVPTAKADVVLTSTVTTMEPTANDTTWDGTYQVSSGKKPGQKVEVTMVQTGEGWKVYSVTMKENAFLLASWGRPDPSAVSLEGLSPAGTVKTSIK